MGCGSSIIPIKGRNHQRKCWTPEIRTSKLSLAENTAQGFHVRLSYIILPCGLCSAVRLFQQQYGDCLAAVESTVETFFS